MFNSKPTKPCLEVDLIHVIAENRSIRLSGRWQLTQVSGGNQLVSRNFNYLVCVKQSNYLIHPDDIEFICKQIKADFKQIKSDFEIRLIDPDQRVHLLKGSPDDVSTERDGFNLYRSALEKRADLGESSGSLCGYVPGKTTIDNIVAGKILLETVFNTSTLGLHVLESVRNSDGEIVDFDILLTNATSDIIAGRKVSGMRMLEGWPHTKDIGLFDKFIHTVETGELTHFEHNYEGDGVSAWFEWIASRLNDGLYVTIEDITKRKNSEVLLKTTADRLQSIFDGVPALIVLMNALFDRDGQPVDFTISAANKAMADFTDDRPEDIVGKKMSALYPKAFQGELLESHIQVFKTGIPFQVEFAYPGSNRWFSLFLTKQIDEQGIVAVAIDITDKKRSEHQKKQNQILFELNEAKTEFFNNVSHEFRTPLTLMLGPVQDLLNKFATKPIYAPDLPKLQMIHRNALRLEKLVNTLLNFARVEAGRSEAFFKPTDLAEYTTLLAGNFRSAIESAGLKFKIDCESSELIYINHDMWEKIVLNLLSNAFKFTFEGRITIKLKSHKRHVKLHVRDTGIGINGSNLSKIFERFSRIPQARSRSVEGSGIGLALVKELVKMHGGNIEVKSKEGAGSVFTVSIPKGKTHLPARNIYEIREEVAPSPLASVFAHEAMSWNPGGNHPTPSMSEPRPTILLIDDNSDMREYICSVLCHQYFVATADNGMRALEIIAGGLDPKLILADIMMPGMDGYELLAEIRKREGMSRTPFLIISARASEEDRIKGLFTDIDDYLVKPFSSAALLAIINSRIRQAMRYSK